MGQKYVVNILCLVHNQEQSIVEILNIECFLS